MTLPALESRRSAWWRCHGATSEGFGIRWGSTDNEFTTHRIVDSCVPEIFVAVIFVIILNRQRRPWSRLVKVLFVERSNSVRALLRVVRWVIRW